MSGRLSLRLDAKLDALSRIDEAVGELAQSEDWAPDIEFQIKLALEELAINVVNYAYGADDEEHGIELDMVSEKDSIVIELADRGKPFDPLTEAPDPDVTSPIESRPVGGLGVHFAKTLMDDVEYRRESGRNRLRIVTRKVR